MNELLDRSNRTKLMSTDPVDWLAAIASRGDQLAFASLFGHFAPRLKTYLMRGGMQAGQAEELAQETMLMVWRKASSFDSAAGTPAAWIFVIARNLRIDAARRDKRSHAKIDPLEDAPQPPGADDLLQHRQHSDRLRAAMARLPPEQAEVLHLSFFDERPHSEIEQRLGIPLGTVKSRLRLAMNRLRNLLDELK